MTTETMNAATYKVSLWLQNDQGLWEMFKNLDADEIQQGFEEMLDQELRGYGAQESFAHQLLLDLLGTVDWWAVAESMKEE